MATYFITGGTGFIGTRLLPLLLARPDAVVHVLVRPQSAQRLAALSEKWPNRENLVPVIGDLGADLLGVTIEPLRGKVDHVIHLGALYDLTASSAENDSANVRGTAHVIDFARAVGARWLHHTSSIAVAGNYRGQFTEAAFGLGQSHPTPYHATKFAAERLVREQRDTPFRVYRPAVVVGESTTGVMDKVDGIYYLFPALSRLAHLPAALPLVGPNLGYTSVVPVDYVAAAIDHLVHVDAPSGTTYHLGSRRPLTSTQVYNALAGAAGAPKIRATAPSALTTALQWPARRAAALADRRPGVSAVAQEVVNELGIPPQVLPVLAAQVQFDTAATQRALAGSGISAPDLADYAPALYRYWRRNLDPDRAARRRPKGVSPLAGRRVLITGASSGIGRATALRAAQRGAEVVLVARRREELEEVRAEITAQGGAAFAYPCDLTDGEAVDALAKQVLAERGTVDMLVNNAGRSIRRSIRLSVERVHDYERTMTLNYFGPLRLILALLPAMVDQHYGRVVNVTTQGLQFHAPRFSAYLGSKAALDEFSKAAARELLADGVTFSNVRMPLVRTDMIAPSKAANRSVPKLSPGQAATLVLRALEGRSDVVNTRAGEVVAAAELLAPNLVRTLIHLAAFQATPETAPEAADAAAPRRAPAVALAGTVTRLLWRSL